MRYLLWDDIKTVLDITKDEADFPLIPQIEASVIAAFESYTRRTFKKADYSVYLLEHSRYIMLDALPISTVTSITTDAGVSYQASQIKTRSYGLEIINPILFDQPVTVKYNGGYSKLPADMYRALILQTAHEFQTHDNIGASSVTTEGGTVTTPSLGLLAEVKRLLDPIKHPGKGIM